MIANVSARLTQAPARSADVGPVMPGEPEIRSRERRSEGGIPLPEPTWRDLVELGRRCHIELPQLVEGRAPGNDPVGIDATP
jgi:LDH2 family malate/lactate/ureidoglycolate dehydrogenase